MSVMRAFIAVNLSPEIQQRLDEVIAAFKRRLEHTPVRWVQAKNIHLTLKFLGDVSVTNLDLLKKQLQAEVAGCHSFEISVGGAGSFPSVHRPRVIWVGVKAPPDLTTVQTGVEAAMARLGYPPEERPFSPHLTIGRVARNCTPQDFHLISSALEKEKVGFLGALCVQAVNLYRSDLQPGGAVYTSIFTARLSA